MRIGIIGAGQLGLMLGTAAKALGMRCQFLDPADEPPAAAVGTVVRRAFDDEEALHALAAESDVVTYEFENVPVRALAGLSDTVPVYPPPRALEQAQDRLLEKRLFERLGIPLPEYRAVDSAADLAAAAASIGLPLIVKTRRFGYDGKGQLPLRDEAGIAETWQALGAHALIAEQRVDFDYEVSAIGVRNPEGLTRTYPLTHNIHAGGILRQSHAPVIAPRLDTLAGEYLITLMEALDYVGVLALELFVVGDRLLANEFAPRVHNSGHWTIEGAKTSQFANHLLAVTGQAPGDTACTGHAGMLNLIGNIPGAARNLAYEDCYLHDYGKAPRPGRKLGHITILRDSATERDRVMAELAEIVTQSTPTAGHPP